MSESTLCSPLSFGQYIYKIFAQNCIYRQIVGIPMSTKCAPLVTYLFCFDSERDFMVSPVNAQADVIEAFNFT